MKKLYSLLFLVNLLVSSPDLNASVDRSAETELVDFEEEYECYSLFNTYLFYLLKIIGLQEYIEYRKNNGESYQESANQLDESIGMAVLFKIHLQCKKCENKVSSFNRYDFKQMRDVNLESLARGNNRYEKNRVINEGHKVVRDFYTTAQKKFKRF